MVTKEQFAQHTREALEGYYDAVRLQSSPLTDLLQLSPDPGETRITCLRRLLREAIETLKPPGDIPYGAREWLSYRLLWLHCIQSRSQFAITEELGIGRTTYYRYLAEAFATVGTVLWDRYEAIRRLENEPEVIESADAQAIEHAISLSDCSQVQTICLAEAIEDARRTTRPLENQQGVQVRVSLPMQSPDIYCNPAMLRRILLTLLTEAIRTARNNTIDLSVTTATSEVVWAVGELHSDLLASADGQPTTSLAVSRGLVTACKGRLWLVEEQPGHSTLFFALPISHPRTIFVVDDDPDTTELYARYLGGRDYLIRTARTAQDVRDLLGQGVPDLVVLDVLLPGEDGWTVLQQLKTMPETVHVPVVVCSVLSQPLLALALGATEVLRKPVEQQALLGAVTQALRSAENRG